MRVTSRCGGAPKRRLYLATELRRAFVPHTPARAARVEVLIQHQLPRLL